MEKLKIWKKNKIKCVILFLGILMIVLYRISVRIEGMTKSIYLHFTAPVHRALSDACDLVDFSVAELLIAGAVIGFLAYTCYSAVIFFLKKERITVIISWVLTCAMLVSIIYGGFCIMWGPYYSSSDAQIIYGINPEGVEHEDLIAVDRYFVQLANEYGTRVNRDAEGHFIMDEDYVFSHACNLYDDMEKQFPMLSAQEHKAKPVRFSRIMSYIGFTGFFFPFTAEANINMDSPQMMIPATIAHELAHQRGVAAEDEANFTAILACLSDGDENYVYSACLLALIHLQNALYKSGDKQEWQNIKDLYSDEVLFDLKENSTYWKQFDDTVANRISEETYDAFLKSYDQTLGRETYGACVDLLVEYFK